jgi:uncharacterized DUF497 family protein
MIDPKDIDIHRMRWDAWNVAHIGREGHKATPQEVAQIVFSSKSIMQTAKGGRVLVLGPTSKRRMLVAVLDPEEPGVWYCVSARTASRKERALYQVEYPRRRKS